MDARMRQFGESVENSLTKDFSDKGCERDTLIDRFVFIH